MFKQFTHAIEDFISTALEHFKVPSAMIMLIKGNETFLKLHGEKRLGEGQPIAASTVFSLASCSKAFCATAAALLVDEGKLEWGEAVTETVPEYVLDDPWITNNVKVRDLLGMRVGLKREGVVEFGFDCRVPFEKMAPRLQHVSYEAGFRERYTYNNSAYATMALLISRKTGMPYAEFLKTRLFAPLGMETAISCPGILTDHPDHYFPHIRLGERVEALPGPRCVGFEGSSCVYLSAQDSERWLRFQLNRGQIDGKQIVSGEQMAMTHHPHSIGAPVVEPAEIGKQFAQYCMGWEAFQHNGKSMLKHTGSELGASNQITFCPDLNMGIAVYCGLYTTAFMAISYHLLDVLTGYEPQDWIAQAQQRLDKITSEQIDNLQKEYAVDDDASIVDDLGPFTGRYASPESGTITVTNSAGGLFMKLNNHPMCDAQLVPLGGNIFRVVHEYKGMDEDLFGEPKRVRITLENDQGKSLSHSLFGNFQRV